MTGRGGLEENELIQIISEDLEKIIDANLPWGDLADKTIMITGGGGFLASYIVKSFLTASKKHNLNIKVISVIRDKKRGSKRLLEFLDNPSLTLVEQDISAPLNKDFPEADYIIHSASPASPKLFGLNPIATLKANSIGTSFLLDHAVKSEAKKFLFFSSGEVYGQVADVNEQIRESDYGYIDPLNLRSAYAESKRMGENMCIAWATSHGIDVSIVRPFHTYGPGMDLQDGRVYADFVSDVVHHRNIALKSDGQSRRPFCYISDATTGFLTVLMKGASKHAYNVANPTAEISILKLAELITELFPKSKINIEMQEREKGDSYLNSPIFRQIPCIDKIEALGWKPTVELKEGFRRTILSYWNSRSPIE